jgi:hypothetical protein
LKAFDETDVLGKVAFGAACPHPVKYVCTRFVDSSAEIAERELPAC